MLPAPGPCASSREGCCGINGYERDDPASEPLRSGTRAAVRQGVRAAAFGAVEAQGRGSLHPRILVWLIQMSLRDVLDRLMRDRADFKHLIGRPVGAPDVEKAPAGPPAGRGEARGPGA